MVNFPEEAGYSTGGASGSEEGKKITGKQEK
jgi:hypothetical protein